MSDAAAASLTPEGVRRAIYGSKMTLVTEMFTLTTIWGLKGCLCMMYHRLTLVCSLMPIESHTDTSCHRKRIYGVHLAVKIIACYCCFAYVIVVVLFLGLWCRPFNQYWAVPVEVCKLRSNQISIQSAADYRIAQCSTYYHHLIFATAWNISADLALLSIPFFIIPKSQLPLRRKVLIHAVLGLGAFNVRVSSGACAM